jgi:dephospho-CoA kinase
MPIEEARAEVERRMAAQFSDEYKIKAEVFVIDNSGSLDATEKQVREIWGRLTVVRHVPQG